MKKHLSFILIAAMIATLLYGCGGSSTGTSNDAPKDKETASAETAPTADQEKTSEDAAPSQEETTTAPAEAGETTAAPAEDGETTGTPTGFKVISITTKEKDVAYTSLINYDQDGDIISNIWGNGDTKQYGITLIDKEYDENGKWVSSTIYTVNQETAIDPENTDIFKTEENITATETCSYDDDALIVERSDSSGNVIQIDTYNEKHQKVLSQYGVDRETPMTVKRKYDEQGILIEEEIENAGFVQTYKYTPIGVTSYNTSNTMKDGKGWEIELKYDENGLPVGGIASNSGAESVFELDEYGNLIHIETKDGDTVISTTDYEILPIYE